MSSRIIYARHCTVQEVGLEEARAFLELHHRAGSTADATPTNLGLYHDGELVALAQFVYPRTAAAQRKWTTELLRLAFHRDIRIPGGASKLIKAYCRIYNPADIFTYQDTTGEVGSVYEHCGFTLVREMKEKTYLIAPGKTLATASRKEALGMAYATRYGPDRILGTKLGEVYREDGTRKSNRELFLEELGWHEESTSGDRVYEWLNPNVTFYTYRITASDSDKYYIGVSHVKKGKATVEDCLSDGYYGSGAKNNQNKFHNWKKKHRGSLKKEILGLYNRKADAYRSEEELVGDNWRTDPLCLNGTTGGKDGWKNRSETTHALGQCALHGKTKFIGSRCYRCIVENSITIELCELHGETKHRGGTCHTCTVQDSLKLDICPTHGEVTHRGKSCVPCASAKPLKQAECEVHGETLHRGAFCIACGFLRLYKQRRCETHGETTFQGDVCLRCHSSKIHSEKECAIHGPAIHKGNTCTKCSNQATVKLKECPIHGQAKFQGDTCAPCRSIRIAHKRWHGNKPNAACPHCFPAI